MIISIKNLIKEMRDIMEYITIGIAIIGCLVSVSTFFINQKNKSDNDLKAEQKEFSKHNLIEYRLKKLDENVEKILSKLDFYDKEIEEKVNKAIDNHVKIYHNNNLT